MKEEAFQKSLHYAAQTGATATDNLDDYLCKQVQELLSQKGPSRKLSADRKNSSLKRVAMEEEIQQSNGAPAASEQLQHPKPTTAKQRANVIRPFTTDLSHASIFHDSIPSSNPLGGGGGGGGGSVTAPGHLEKHLRPDTTNTSMSASVFLDQSDSSAMNMQATMGNAELMQELGQLRLLAQEEQVSHSTGDRDDMLTLSFPLC
jgi:hypothetical protein